MTRISTQRDQYAPFRNRQSFSLRLVIWPICAMLIGCGGPTGTPEEAVRAWVTDGEAAAESKDRRTLVGMISESYADGRGNSRKDIGNMFRFYFLRAKNVAILTKVDSVEMHSDSAADVTLTVGLAGTDDSLLGLSADAFRFELELENDGDDWLLIGARWGELGRELR